MFPFSSSFGKQILGALAGAAVALVLYGAYSAAAPAILALLPVHQADIKVQTQTRYTPQVRREHQDQIIQKARQILGSHVIAHP